MGCGSLIIGVGWGTGAVQGAWKNTLLDATKVVQMGKLVYHASMCMQVYCAFLCMLLHEELSFATQQGSTNDWQKN